MAESFASSSTWTGQVRPPAASHAVALRTLGCKVNQAESAEIVSALLKAGFRVVPEGQADIVIINTCTVTAEADHKVRKAVRHAQALPQGPLVAVTGCMAVLEPEVLESLGDRILVEPDKHAIVESLRQSAGSCLGDASQGPISTAVSGMERWSRCRMPLKVEDGCDAYCAYCIVPFARGVPRSVALPDVVRRARELAQEGVAEIVLTGINIGRYRDDESGTGLDGLLVAVADTGIPRLRLSSIEPHDITDALIETLVRTPNFCEHLHVPLQSGSDGVLARMGRGYSTSEFEQRIERVRKRIPGLSVTTDVMAGFPGETVEDVERTVAVCERVGFAKTHVFRFSSRPGTAAAEMSGQLDVEEIARRAEFLREAGQSLHVAWLDAHIDCPAEVLVERVVERDGKEWIAGTSRDYMKVEAVAEGVSVGQRVRLVVTGHDSETAIGEAESEVARGGSVVES